MGDKDYAIKELYYEFLDRYEYENIVMGGGNEDSDILMIGEAPGAQEELQGKPFVGKAGKNLDMFLENICLKREDIYITNTVKIRPYKINKISNKKNNRPPNSKEIDIFKEYLLKEIDIINPKLIITLGNVPLKAIVDKKASIGDYHGKIIQNKYNIFPLYHPASIIYNKSLKDIYYEDLEGLKKYISYFFTF